MGDAGISASGVNTEIVTPLSQWAWQLMADTRDWNSPAELRSTYAVSNGGYLLADNNPSSRVSATIEERDVEVFRFGERNTRFRGFLNVRMDYRDATYAGVYTGRVTVTLECDPAG